MFYPGHTQNSLETRSTAKNGDLSTHRVRHRRLPTPARNEHSSSAS